MITLKRTMNDSDYSIEYFGKSELSMSEFSVIDVSHICVTYRDGPWKRIRYLYFMADSSVNIRVYEI